MLSECRYHEVITIEGKPPDSVDCLGRVAAILYWGRHQHTTCLPYCLCLTLCLRVVPGKFSAESCWVRPASVVGVAMKIVSFLVW